MKSIDMDGMTIVHRGEDCPLSETLTVKEIMKILEKKEKYISWLQPVHSTRAEDQIPALYVFGKYYMLSLRMMKCVWRHVRLHKGFVNRETALYGGIKLMIPMSLYAEKIRTQRRFHSMRIDDDESVKKLPTPPPPTNNDLEEEEDKDDNNSPTPTPPTQPPPPPPPPPLPSVTLKSNQNASTKVTGVVHKILMPLLHAPIGDSVSFDLVDDSGGGGSAVAATSSSNPSSSTAILQQLQQSQPEILKDKNQFIQLMSEMYDTSCASAQK